MEVDLDRAALPVAADGVLQRVLDLGAVEAPSPGEISNCNRCGAGFPSAPIRPCPRPRPSRCASRDAWRPHLGEAEVAVDLLQQGREIGALALELFLGTENVAVVLGEAARASCRAASRTARCGGTGRTRRSAAAARGTSAAGVEDLRGRAVHGLQAVDAVLGLRREHVFTVVVPVARLLPQRDVENLRRLHFLVAVVAMTPACTARPARPALGVPEDQAGASS